MNINTDHWLVRLVMSRIQHYDHEKYWKMRAEVVNPHSSKSKLTRLYYLYRIKKSDAFANASMGTAWERGPISILLPFCFTT